MSDEPEVPKKKYIPTTKGLKRSDRLSLKQRLFAEKLLVPGETQTGAYLKVYGGSEDTASQRATMAMKSPALQAHISDVIDSKFPDLSDDCATTLANMIRDPEVPANVKLKAIDLVAKYKGWASPSRSEHLHAQIDMSRYKLPGGDK